MEIVKIEGIPFDIARYKVVRMTQYSTSEGEFYAPADMKFFKYEDLENKIPFEGHEYSQQKWIGVTTYSQDKEKISHNMHFEFKDANGQIIEKDDYPVINTFGVDVHNAGDKYLIWELNDCAPLCGEELPTTDSVLQFDEPIYIVKRAKSEELEDGIELTFADMFKRGYDVTPEDMQRFKNMMYRPYQYIKINGILPDGYGYDVTTVTIGSWCIHVDNCTINRIERETMEFNELPQWDKFSEASVITKEEFDAEFNRVLENIKK